MNFLVKKLNCLSSFHYKCSTKQHVVCINQQKSSRERPLEVNSCVVTIIDSYPMSKAMWQLNCMECKWLFLPLILQGWESNESKLPSKHGRRQDRICVVLLWIPVAYTAASEQVKRWRHFI